MGPLAGPRGKLLLAALLLLLLLLAGASGTRTGGAAPARFALGLAGCALAGAWAWRSRGAGSAGPPVARPLEVRSRVGLSARCALALVEVEGQQFLVVHGEGFATIRRTRTGPRKASGAQGEER